MVKIVTDTTASLPADLAQRLDIAVVPQIIVFGDEALREGIDINNATFMRRLRAERDLPKTSAPPP